MGNVAGMPGPPVQSPRKNPAGNNKPSTKSTPGLRTVSQTGVLPSPRPVPQPRKLQQLIINDKTPTSKPPISDTDSSGSDNEEVNDSADRYERGTNGHLVVINGYDKQQLRQLQEQLGHDKGRGNNFTHESTTDSDSEKEHNVFQNSRNGCDREERQNGRCSQGGRESDFTSDEECIIAQRNRQINSRTLYPYSPPTPPSRSPTIVRFRLPHENGNHDDSSDSDTGFCKAEYLGTVTKDSIKTTTTDSPKVRKKTKTKTKPNSANKPKSPRPLPSPRANPRAKSPRSMKPPVIRLESDSDY